MRRIRFVPTDGALVEVTCRTLHGAFLLKPSPTVNEIILGTLGRAQRKYGVRCCAFAFLSNHFHLLLEVDDARQLARFMGYLNSNLAREVGRIAQWRERFWSKRYQAALISGEEAAQIGRLKYVLAQGCKEGLVRRPQDWPGVHASRALLGQETLQGIWIDRTQQHIARKANRNCESRDFTTPEVVQLSPLPCSRHLTSEVYRERIRELVEEIVADARTARGTEPVARPEATASDEPLGHHELSAEQRSPKSPFCHAASSLARKPLEEAYRWFFAAYRNAAEHLKRGEPAEFPLGSFPPALPFVNA